MRRDIASLAFLFIFFVTAIFATFAVVFLGTSSIFTFLVGLIIIGFFVFDFLRTGIFLHVYQIILIYFYFSLVLFHSFNSTTADFYFISYLINLLHCLFFVVGYYLIPTNNVIKPLAPKQNIISFFYLVFIMLLASYNLFSMDSNNYNAQFLTFEQTRSMPIYEIYVTIIFNQMIDLLLLLTSVPILLTVITFFTELMSYPLSGVKGSLVISILSLLLVIQIYIFRLSLRGLLFLGIVGAFFCFFLIGSTAFRGDLSLQSLGSTLTNIDILTERWHYFILQSPESSHIRYTADIYEMIEHGVIDFRYGFDYYRFFLYPFKEWVNGWEFASYNQYAILTAGRNVSAGLYLGLAGELFWNFGWFFPLFSIATGATLKWFTNYGLSGSYFGFALYLSMFHSMIWFLYRGEANSFILFSTSLALVVIIFRLSFSIRSVRVVAFYITKFVVKRKKC